MSSRTVDGNGSDSHVGFGVDMGIEHFRVVHLIELITAQDKDILAIVLIKVAKVFTNGISGTFIPFGTTLHSLLRSQEFDEPTIEVIETIGLSDMLVERYTKELRDNINAIDSAVQAIADWNIDQPILASERDSGLGANFSKRKKPSTATTTEDQRNHLAHIIEHRNHLTFQLIGTTSNRNEFPYFVAFSGHP